MDLRDPNIMDDTDRPDESGTPSSAHPDSKTDLDQNVEKIVGNISSWFSGFAKKSQDSINQARKEMESRGGIVNYAKSEYAKLESSIEEAQKKAQENADHNLSALPATSAEDAFLQSQNSKGKQRAINDEDSSAAAAEASGGTANAGPTLGASVTSLFAKLAADPRVAQLQQSLSSTIHSVSSTAGTTTKDADGTERTTAPTPLNIQESLSKLSLTIQSHLPHLDLKESQQLATKYLHATENYAGKIQSDMKEFVGELVRVVPPEAEAAKTELPAAAASESVGKDTSAPVQAEPISQSIVKTSAPVKADSATPAVKAIETPSVDDEEDFAWDGEDDEAAAAAVSTDAALASAAKAQSQPSTTSTTVSAAQDSKLTSSKAQDSDEDSDWE